MSQEITVGAAQDCTPPDLPPDAPNQLAPTVETLNEGYLNYMHEWLLSQCAPDAIEGDKKVELLMTPSAEKAICKTVDTVLSDYARERYLSFCDRLPDTLTPEQLRFALGRSRPPWWRFVARWRWRKRNEKLLRDCNKEEK